MSKWFRKTRLALLVTNLSKGTIQSTLRLVMNLCSCKIMPPSHISKKIQKSYPKIQRSKNPIQNLWLIVKNEVRSGGRQFSNNEQLWDEISEVCASISPSTIHKLTKSVSRKLQEWLRLKSTIMFPIFSSILRYIDFFQICIINWYRNHSSFSVVNLNYIGVLLKTSHYSILST